MLWLFNLCTSSPCLSLVYVHFKSPMVSQEMRSTDFFLCAHRHTHRRISQTPASSPSQLTVPALITPRPHYLHTLLFSLTAAPPKHAHTLIFFFLSLASVAFYSSFLSLSLSLSVSPSFSLSPPFCGWQSPWDCAHSWLENLKLCPNTSFQDLPREIPHGCFYTADLPFWLPLSPLNYSTVLLPKTPLPPSSPPKTPLPPSLHHLCVDCFHAHSFNLFELHLHSIIYVPCTDLMLKVQLNRSEFNLHSTLNRRTFLHPSTARTPPGSWRKTDGSWLYI